MSRLTDLAAAHLTGVGHEDTIRPLDVGHWRARGVRKGRPRKGARSRARRLVETLPTRDTYLDVIQERCVSCGQTGYVLVGTSRHPRCK